MRYQGLALSGERAPRDRRVRDRTAAPRAVDRQHDRQLRPRLARDGNARCRRSGRRPVVERLGPGDHEHPLSARRSGRPHRRAGAASPSQMGVRLSRRHLGVGAADDRRRTPVRRQPERHRLFARRGDAAASCGRSRRRAACAPRSRLAVARGAAARDASELRRVFLRSERLRLRGRRGDGPCSCGRGRSTIIRWCGSPDRRRSTRVVSTSRPRRTKKAASRPATPAARSAAAIVALDARTGDVIWKTYTIPETPRLLRVYADGTELRGPSGGAIWSAPTIDAKRGVIYAGVGNTYSGAAQPTTDAILAFDLKTGALRWSRQMAPSTPDVFGCTPGEVNCGERAGPDFDFGASPVLATLPSGRRADRRRAEIGRRLRARSRQERRAGLALSRRRRQRARRHPVGHRGRWRARLRAGRRDLQPDARRPARGRSRDRRARLVSRRRSRRSAESRAGRAAARSFPRSPRSPASSFRRPTTARSARIRRPTAGSSGRSTRTGSSRRINGLRAKGGSMNGPAPVVAGGMVYVSSGYGVFGLRPGNVLLAFATGLRV